MAKKSKKGRRGKKGNPKKSWKAVLVKYAIGIGVFIPVALILFYFSVSIGIFGSVPTYAELEEMNFNYASEVYSEDHVLLGKYYLQNRTDAKYEDFPEHLVNALVATEDARFWEHKGVDTRSLLRVVFKSILMGDKRSGGGSTLTQQLAKNYFGRKSYGPFTMLINKAKEHLLASRMEKVYKKEQIIELYLNSVPFGENLYGIDAAANRYFSKKPRQLKIQESAVLVGLLKANTAYNPRLHPQRSKWRRNVVIEQMLKEEYITASESDSLKSLPLKLDYRDSAERNYAGYFLNHIEWELETLLNSINKKSGRNYQLKTDGLKVYTTLNSRIQREAIKSMKSHLTRHQSLFDKEWKAKRLDKRNAELIQKGINSSAMYKYWTEELNIGGKQLQDSIHKKKGRMMLTAKGLEPLNISLADSVTYSIKQLQAAVTAVDPASGAVLAYVGGRDSQSMPYDLVQAERQMASTFKPFVYAAALEEDWWPCDYIDNTEKIYSDFDDWTPKNYNKISGGKYSMKGALSASVNIPAVETYFRAGHDAVEDIAVSSDLVESLPDLPSVALGSASTTLEHMTSAYSIFAKDGQYRKSYRIERIEDRDGNIIYEHDPGNKRKVLKETNQKIMRAMLEDVVDSGTGRAIRTNYRIPADLAGKTGTSQNYSDAWFVGFNPSVVIGVWVGFNHPSVHFISGNGSGSKAALPIFAKMYNGMDKHRSLHKYTRKAFPRTPSYVTEAIDCPDYRDDSFFEEKFDWFDNDRTTTDKQERKNERQRRKKEKRPEMDEKEKKSIWRRIFGKKKR